MHTPQEPSNQHSGIYGALPIHWCGTKAVDGDATEFAKVGKGSTYTRLDLTNKQILGTYTKLKEDSRDDDWVEGLGCVTETVAYTDFTDGGSTSGTYTLSKQVPSGAYIQRTTIINVTGFAGDTSATIQIGDGVDVDRFNTGTPNVFADAAAVSAGVISGAALITEATNVVLTITSGSDWGAVTAGQLTIRVYYFN